MKIKKTKIVGSSLVFAVIFGFYLALRGGFAQNFTDETSEIMVYNSRSALVKGVKIVKLDRGENTIFFENLGSVDDISIDGESVSAVVFPKKSYGNFEGFAGKDAVLKTAFSSKRGKILYYNDAKNWAMLYKNSILVSPEGNLEIDCEKCDYSSLKSPFVKVKSDEKTTKAINYSYSLSNLVWRPFYVLKIDQNPSLVLGAVISNFSQKSLDLQRVSFISDGQNNTARGYSFMAKSIQNDKAESAQSPVNIEDNDYLIFEKNLDFKIPSDSEAKIKLLKTSIKPEIKYIISNYLGDVIYRKSGFADLVFEFENNAVFDGKKVALPGGEIEIKSDKYTSFTAIQKTAFGEKVKVNAQNSVEISFVREVENFKKTVDFVEFDLKITVKNASKSRKNLVIIENFDQKFVVNCEKNCKKTMSGIEIFDEIDANSEKNFVIGFKKIDKK